MPTAAPRAVMSPPGETVIRTPARPASTAPQRHAPTRSPRMGTARIVRNRGEAKLSAWASASGISANDQNRRSEEHTSELQSLMRISYAVFCLKKKNSNTHIYTTTKREVLKRTVATE